MQDKIYVLYYIDDHGEANLTGASMNIDILKNEALESYQQGDPEAAILEWTDTSEGSHVYAEDGSGSFHIEAVPVWHK